MGTGVVEIYERVKQARKWSTRPVEMPRLKRDGTLFLQGDQRGRYGISRYQDRRKQWQTVRSRISECHLPCLLDAMRQADDKAWFLNNSQ
jgi:hypothetical protein